MLNYDNDYTPLQDDESICPTCNGSGEGMSEYSKCPTCGGSGDDLHPWGKRRLRGYDV